MSYLILAGVSLCLVGLAVVNSKLARIAEDADLAADRASDARDLLIELRLGMAEEKEPSRRRQHL